jgi:hypothetical protein
MQYVVFAAAVGVTPYNLENDVSYQGDVIEARPQPSAAGCATACTKWQSQGIPCSAWTWLPHADSSQQGACTLLSKMSGSIRLTKGQGGVSGAIGKPLHSAGCCGMVHELRGYHRVPPTLANQQALCSTYNLEDCSCAWLMQPCQLCNRQVTVHLVHDQSQQPEPTGKPRPC